MQVASDSFVGESRYAQRVCRLVDLLGPEDCTVAVTGPTGSGKRIVMQALHRASGRKVFRRISAAQLDPTFDQSNLFGHLRGSYSGADRQRAGFFAEAEGGTAGIDEIGDMSRRTQARLLDAVEGEEVQALGADRGFIVNVRLIVAAHVTLTELVAANRMRPDLCQRLDQERIILEPLARHREDIPVLARVILHRLSERLGIEVPDVEPQAMRMLMVHDWPGNVRQLACELERALRRARWAAPGETRPVITASCCFSAGSPPVRHRGRRVIVRRDDLKAALDQCDGNGVQASATLGLALRTFRRLQWQFGLQAGG